MHEDQSPEIKILSTTSVFLSDDSHRRLCVQHTRRSKDSHHQLVAQNVLEKYPENTSKVTMYNIVYNESTPCMAFGFEVKEKNVFPVVTHEQGFKVLDVKDQINFDKKFLFQWGDPPITGTNLGTLKSVAEPKKYLYVEKKSGKVSITDQGNSLFSIENKNTKQEKANAASRNTIVCKIQENEMNICKSISWRRRSLKRRPSCCEGSVASHTPQRCNDRKKRMKMSVKS